MLRTIPLGLLIALCSPIHAHDDFPAPVNTQAPGEHPPSPREMLDLFELPEGFKVTLFAGEPDVQQPIAFDFDDHGRIWVAENYSYSAHGKIDDTMRDRVVILHDKDGDGEHDERKVFWDKGHMLTGLIWGYGGLWILNDGTLSFIPDKNGDDIPDSEPVPLLNGWTKEAGHNMVNGLLWGPDGWLYGRHGILDTSWPGTIDTPREERQPINCGIWRFHPVKHTFEIVCHGTTNPWGLDYNEVGDMFMSNNVIGHLWHVIPGAHYQRMFGRDFNPHCYELMGPISDHYHWDESGKWHESRDGKADGLGGGHSHCGLMLYYGQNFPKEYRGKAFMCNTHGRCVNVDRIERKGSSYVAKHEPNFLQVNTPWFRGVELKYGPAGCVYLSDWSDNGECHDHDGVHRTSGRIYRISYGEVTVPTPHSLGLKGGNHAGRYISWPVEAAFEGQPWHRNEWLVRRGRRIAQETLVPKSIALDPMIERTDKLREKVFGDTFAPNSFRQLKLLLSDEAPPAAVHNLASLLASIDAFDGDTIRSMLLSESEYTRAFAVRHIGENRRLQEDVRDVLLSLLNLEHSSYVGVAFAQTAQRIKPRRYPNQPGIDALGMEIVEKLVRVKLAAQLDTDPTFGRMTWYAWESRQPVKLHPNCTSERVHRHFTRWIASQWETYADYCLQLILDRLPGEGPRNDQDARILAAQLDGLESALAGRRAARIPERFGELRKWIENSRNQALLNQFHRIAAALGERNAMSRLVNVVAQRHGNHPARSLAIKSLAGAQHEPAIPIFFSLLNDRAVYIDICTALADFDDDPRIPKELLKRWNGLRHGAREAATDTMCSRKSYAVKFTQAIADGRVDSSILTAAHVRQLNAFNDDSITAVVDKHWGVVNKTPESLEAAIAKWKQELANDVLSKANLRNGAALFKKSCANCHRLYGEGGKIGPDLTGGNRANLDYLLTNIINPSREVPKQYTVSVIALKSGRLVNGVVLGETERALTVQTDKEQIVVAKADVDERTRTKKSLMPDGLLDSLNEQQVIDLLAFVMHRRSTGR